MTYTAEEWEERPNKSDKFTLIRPNIDKLIPLRGYSVFASTGIYLILAMGEGLSEDEDSGQIQFIKPVFSTAVIYN